MEGVWFQSMLNVKMYSKTDHCYNCSFLFWIVYVLQTVNLEWHFYLEMSYWMCILYIVYGYLSLSKQTTLYSTCKKNFFKVFKFNQIIFIIQYRNFQYRVPRCPVSSSEMSSAEYRDVTYVQDRDVQVQRCPDTSLGTFFFQFINICK
jgi:hypothetical protein